MNENVSLQVVSTPEGPVTVITDKVLLDFWKWTISIFIHNRLPGKWIEDILMALITLSNGLEFAMFKKETEETQNCLKNYPYTIFQIFWSYWSLYSLTILNRSQLWTMFLFLKRVTFCIPTTIEWLLYKNLYKWEFIFYFQF